MKMRVLSRSDVEKALRLENVMKTVERVYRLKAEGEAVLWPTVFYDFKTGEKDMDIRSGYMRGMESHGLKVINWTAANTEKGLPALIGVIMVFDTVTGLPLGVLDGSYITGIRTGCAGAIGAKYLARKDGKTLFVLGAGGQGFFQTAGFVQQFPQLETVYVADPMSKENADRFVANIKQRLRESFGIERQNLSFVAVGNDETSMAKAVGESDMIVTATPSRAPIIKREWVKPGTHLSCIGSDMSGKEEIDPELFRGAVIVCDDKEHCMDVGEMEIPLKTGVITEKDIRCEIGELVSGSGKCRENDAQITIYDACGMALLDIATAKSALEYAAQENIGQVVDI